MYKTLLNTKEDLDSLIKDNTGWDGYYGNVVAWLDGPDKYPCVLMWEITDDPNGPAYIHGEYVYLDDFEI